MRFKWLLLTDVVPDVFATEKTLDDVYMLLEEVQSGVSKIENQLYYLEEALHKFQTAALAKLDLFQTAVLEKLDLLQETCQTMPQFDQVENITALLLMLVCFELMRLLRGWTRWHKVKGGSD